MMRWERVSFNVFHAVVSATGLAYWYMKVGLATDDPFAVINHPWQPAMLALHLLAAPILVALFGMLFRSHTLKKILSPNPSNRRSGWTSLVGFSVMALSGYALQVAAAPSWVTALVWLHIGSGLLFLAGYGVHLVIGWRLVAASADPARDALRRAAGTRP